MKLSLQLIALALSASAIARPHHGHDDKRASSFGMQCIRDPINPTRCLSTGGTKYQIRPIRLAPPGRQPTLQRRSPTPVMRPELVEQRCASKPSSFLCRHLYGKESPKTTLSRRNPSPVFDPRFLRPGNQCAENPSDSVCQLIRRLDELRAQRSVV